MKIYSLLTIATLTAVSACGGVDGSSLDLPESSSKQGIRPVDHGVTFENTSELLAPYSRSATGEGLGGVAWLDYDADGDLDLYLTNGVFASNGLFRNDGAGSFTDVTAAAGVSSGFGNSGVVTGDLDNDGYPDIFLTGEGHVVGPTQTPARLFHNLGNGTFEDLSFTSGACGD